MENKAIVNNQDERVVKGKVYTFIKNFLNKKAVNSIVTASNYENDIRQFFMMVKGKNIEMLTIDDLLLTNEMVEQYQVKLFTNNDISINNGKPYSHTSIARKISSVKKLYSKLEANNYDVKESWFNVDRIKGQAMSYSVLEWHQVEQMIELVKKEQKGDIKACLLETAVVTCFRQNSLLHLKWENIRKEDGVWVLFAEGEAIGKGKKVSAKPIKDDLYLRLMELKKRYGSDRLFPLEKKTVVTMMNRLRDKMGLDETYTFHSLKKCGINEAYELSDGNIQVVAEQGDHSDPTTTMKFYMNKKRKYSEMIGLQIGEKIDLTPLKELSNEQLINLIQKSSRSVQIEIINRLNKM